MARPVNADAQATQAKILATAYGLFASKGIDGVSVRDIARAAKVSLAMVHHYFGSKQGLYDACLERMLEELSGLKEELLSKVGEDFSTPAAVLETAARTGFRFAREHQAAVRLLLRAPVDSGELDPRVRQSGVLPFLDTVSGVVAGVVGRSPESLRLPLQTVVYQIVRYAIVSPRELQVLVSGGPFSDDPEAEFPQAIAAVEDHLVDATFRVLGFERVGRIVDLGRTTADGARGGLEAPSGGSLHH